MKVILRDRKKFAEVRIRKGYGIPEASIQCDLSSVVLYRLETGGTQTVRPLTAKKICEAYNMKFDDLFEIVD